ncbi:hypothetical protein OIU79_021980 [Salix purpurea]|uniref:Uncharacterized protein n=1 Tax=Salix purpurea TaxID=77065 RepID=A0A9Q1AC95_SALPP|nr:hypothetical protein OIU79_021980 [Salix purpurea]
MGSNVSNKAIIFFLSPCTFVCMRFFTARRPPHFSRICK